MCGAKSVEVVNLRNALRSRERSRQMSTKSSLTPPRVLAFVAFKRNLA